MRAASTKLRARRQRLGTRRRRTVLAHEPDGRSWTARENLTDILRRELLGPADGPDEVIEVAPDTRYLVGRIAPSG